jgi:hypothetical protein
MGGHRPPASWALGALLALGTSSVAWAETAEREPIRAGLRAPPGCPASGEFVAQVLARTGRARAAQATEPARTFSLEIEERALGFAGKLRVMTPSREWVERRVEADSCEEVVEALALVAALILDPEAVTDRRRDAKRDEPSWTMPRAAPQGPLPPPFSPTPAPPSPAPLGARVGIGGEIVGGIAKTPMPAGRLWGEIVGRGRGLFRPVVGLGFLVGRARVVGNFQGRADITSLIERLSLCPLALRSPVLSLSPCASADLGIILSSSGDATAWTALGLGLCLDLEVPRPFLFRVEGGGLWQPAKTTFAFELAPGSRDEAHTTPGVGGFLGLGAGINL